MGCQKFGAPQQTRINGLAECWRACEPYLPEEARLDERVYDLHRETFYCGGMAIVTMALFATSARDAVGKLAGLREEVERTAYEPAIPKEQLS